LEVGSKSIKRAIIEIYGMKIAIVGTRGIPNFHGGFEQFAEYFAKYLVEQGHEAYVYNSSLHPYKKDNWNGVSLIHKPDPEDKIGTVGQFIYDFNCILDSRSRNFDVILQLGYTSSSVWNWLFPKSSVIITNMDGLEWKRSKYSTKVQKFLKVAEKLAINHSDVLIADSVGIQSYLQSEYKVSSEFIAYGVLTENEYKDEALDSYDLKANQYNMLIARMEPENNIEVILDGVANCDSPKKFLVIGKVENEFGKYLVEKYKENDTILFLGAIYDLPILNSLRNSSDLYFHGHSVGGTNPSLLEAMASNTLICAHDNIFNKSILKDKAFYFENSEDVTKVLSKVIKSDYQSFVSDNYKKVVNEFNWEIINHQYLDVMIKALNKNG
jgi:glycosyltransferase involved in cell wall biosynthesis